MKISSMPICQKNAVYVHDTDTERCGSTAKKVGKQENPDEINEEIVKLSKPLCNNDSVTARSRLLSL